jgi:hypothetical protein
MGIRRQDRRQRPERQPREAQVAAVRATDIPRCSATRNPVMARVVLPTPAAPVITAPRWATTAADSRESSSSRPTSGHLSRPKPNRGEPRPPGGTAPEDVEDVLREGHAGIPCSHLLTTDSSCDSSHLSSSAPLSADAPAGSPRTPFELAACTPEVRSTGISSAIRAALPASAKPGRTRPPCTGKCRFVRGILVESSPGTPTCGGTDACCP